MEEQKSKGRTGLIVLIIILLIGNIAGGYFIFKGKGEVDDLTFERDELIGDYVEK